MENFNVTRIIETTPVWVPFVTLFMTLLGCCLGACCVFVCFRRRGDAVPTPQKITPERESLREDEFANDDGVEDPQLANQDGDRDVPKLRSWNDPRV